MKDMKIAYITIKTPWLQQKDNKDGTVTNYFALMPIVNLSFLLDGVIIGAN